MTTQGKIVTKSPIGFDDATVQQITQSLNIDVATLYQIHKQFMKHGWYVRGTEWKMLDGCFDGWSEHALEHAETIAERIVAVGGVPIDPTAIESTSAFSFEAAGVPTVRQMLENDLTAEQSLFTKLREHIKSLNNLGDFGSEIMLRHILKEQENIAKKIALYLQEEGLAYALMNKKP